MTNGIHHITAIASDPQTCYDFYTKTLGLRLVKKSINQDQVEAYHLFFGDKAGEPGMDLTFFTFSPVHRGTPGVGEVSRISLAIPESAIDFWQDRLESQDIKTTLAKNHFDHVRLRFQDPDGGRLELVATPAKQFKQAIGELWTTPEISQQNAIGYFHSASMTVTSLPTLAPILQTLGYQQTSTIKQSHLYSLNTGTRAVHIELDEYPDQDVATQGAGSVHHIAFQVDDLSKLQQARDHLTSIGLYPTQVIDRFYFQSVYFRTPAGILFELATTDGPGFTADEPLDSLGEKLSIPPFLESKRAYIESLLTPIDQS